jgi:hypothetical protein
MAPDHHVLLQGEVCKWPGGPYLYYSKQTNVHMKDIDPSTWRHALGINAVNLLRGCLFPSTLDHIKTLIERYPNAVIEFSAYAVGVHGPHEQNGHNAIIWEVREY